jgi:hypothetical protein
VPFDRHRSVSSSACAGRLRLFGYGRLSDLCRPETEASMLYE